VIRWKAPEPYSVVFTTRVGGVSEGPYESLNLGRRTGDDVHRVDENRRIVCTGIGADPERLALNFQLHGTVVNRAVAGRRGTPGDALWTDEPRLPVMAVTADCVPVALVRTDGKPAAAVVHAGRIGILAGVLGVAARTLGGTIAAALGPAAGPCCYDVGEEVVRPYRERFGPGVARDGKLDLWGAAEQALREAGVGHVHRIGLCTICNPDLFFSHRRTGEPRGVQGVVALVDSA
jgi:polyphenol oxidase